MDSSANISRHLPAMAGRQADTAALKVPRGRLADGSIDYLTLSFRELDAEVDRWCARLATAGIRRGDRTLVMVRQGLPLIASVFALFKLGAVPVVIDPGMGLRSFLRCVARSQPRALLGIPVARLLSWIAFPAFRSVAVRVAVPSALTARCPGQGESALRAFAPAATGPDELAAVLFTSGSTGAPKGVRYTHGMFDAQVELIRRAYDIRPGEVDLPLLPVFALFNPALGMTTIVPEIDPRKPAEVDPERILQAIRQEKVTNSFGSPTLWRKLADHAAARAVKLPTVRRVLCAGAPVPPVLWEQSVRLLPHGCLHSPYGATEALPVSSIAAEEVLRETAAATLDGAGTCVGRPLPGVRVRIVPLVDERSVPGAPVQSLAVGEIGEILVSGANVTREYDALPEATQHAKLREDPAGTLWHRMGDCGYLDAAGRLWFCGRKAERVQTANGPVFTEQVEPLMNRHPAVRRSALVGLGPAGHQQPWLVVELADGVRAGDAVRADLLALARRHPQTTMLAGIAFHPRFPVDVRHNAKIHRLTLARWLAARSPSAPPAS